MLQLHFLQNYRDVNYTSCPVILFSSVPRFHCKGKLKRKGAITTKPAGELGQGGRQLTATTSSPAEGVPRYPRR